jgi:DnaA family protein
MFKQLPLDLILDDTYTFQNYWPHANQELIDAIHHYLKTQFPSLLFITGAACSGKTHILKAIHEALKQQKKSVIRFSMADLLSISPNILDGLEQLDCMIIDDIDAIKNHPAWQEALFHCYNRSQDKKCQWIVSAKEAPNQLSMTLKDLQSRLSHGVTWPLKPLNDETKSKILQLRAQMLGLELSDHVADYLIHHYERDMQSQIQRLDILDKASLASTRKITIPFIKEIVSYKIIKD